jgi:amino acid transporter
MALIVGSIIGVGIFNLPTSLAFYGPITLISMALTTVGALALALLFAALSRRLPADGGPYAYARAAFGNPLGFANAPPTACSRPGSSAYPKMACPRSASSPPPCWHRSR